MTVRFEPEALGEYLCTIETGSGFCADVPCIGVGRHPRVVSTDPPFNETNVAVSLLVNPEEAVIGNSILMTCTSVGDEPVISFDITQTAGETVELTPILPGVVAFDAETVGTFTFECVGESVGGIRSAPVAGTVTVSEGGRQPPRGGGR